MLEKNVNYILDTLMESKNDNKVFQRKEKILIFYIDTIKQQLKDFSINLDANKTSVNYIKYKTKLHSLTAYLLPIIKQPNSKDVHFKDIDPINLEQLLQQLKKSLNIVNELKDYIDQEEKIINDLKSSAISLLLK
jgi:hypothetical protein